ncbi:hypothetical protein [Blautia sp.]|uniref:hypothetical protein n=1 Tax=Blautia sp. TaxID=1955243 RepID=UPI003AF81B14
MYLADHYDGAILDIMMPKMDGITVLKNIRAQENWMCCLSDSTALTVRETPVQEVLVSVCP